MTKTKKNYSIDEGTKTITAKMGKLTENDKEDIGFLCKLGYTFEAATPCKRTNSSTRNRSYYKSNLIHSDYVEFEAIAEQSYPKACAWANKLIALGKSEDEEALEKFRAAYAKDKAMGNIFLKNWAIAQKEATKQAKKEARLAA